jgi:hypothetical protein
MQVNISCPNCGWVIFGRAITKVDSSTADLQCVRCKAVVRLTAILLHEGQVIDGSVYWYTYDKDNNKIPLNKSQQTGEIAIPTLEIARKPMCFCSKCDPRVPLFSTEELKQHDKERHGRIWGV